MGKSTDIGFVSRMEVSIKNGGFWIYQELGRLTDIRTLRAIAESPATDAALVERAQAVLTAIQSHLNAVNALCLGSHVGLIHECDEVAKGTTGVITLINGDQVILQIDSTMKQVAVKKLVLELR